MVQAGTAAAAATTSTTHRGGATEAAEGKGSTTTSAMLPSSVVLYSPAVAQLLQAPDLIPVKTFVSTALAAKLRGNAVNYRHIVETIRCVWVCRIWSWAHGYYIQAPTPINFDRSTDATLHDPWHAFTQHRTKDDLETLPRVFLALSSCITTVTADPDRVRGGLIYF